MAVQIPMRLLTLSKKACFSPAAHTCQSPRGSHIVLPDPASQGDTHKLTCAWDKGSWEAHVPGYKITTRFYYIYTQCITVLCCHSITNYLGDNLYCIIAYNAINSWCDWLNGKAKPTKYMLFPAHLHTCQNSVVLFWFYEEEVKLCWGLQV